MNNDSFHKNIEWNYPTPTTSWDKFVGPGATKSEHLLMLLPTVLLTALLLGWAAWQEVQWSIWQYIIAGFLAFDLIGGVITNATAPAKRWYHRSEQNLTQHLKFIALHGIQLLLVTCFFNDFNWWFFAGTYGYLFAAAFLVLKTPLYIQRPVAFGIYTITLLLWTSFLTSVEGFGSIPGLDWFVPVFFFKLLISHLLIEEPYRPQE